jgi:TetR/AcrR family transcriptional regulator, transcriptional repressor for nem operon
MPRPREFDEADVIDQAMQRFWSHGYEATSVDDLCAATGLNRSSLYRAFGSKRELLDLALAAYEDMAARRLTVLLRRHRPIREGLRRFLLGAFDDGADLRGRWGCLVGNCANELAVRDAAAQARLRGSLARIEQVLAEALSAAQAAGEIAASANTRALARFFMSQAQGLRLVAKTKPNRAVLDDIVDTALSVLS